MPRICTVAHIGPLGEKERADGRREPLTEFLSETQVTWGHLGFKEPSRSVQVVWNDI